jgi:hypothetical protein
VHKGLNYQNYITFDTNPITLLLQEHTAVITISAHIADRDVHVVLLAGDKGGVGRKLLCETVILHT